MRIMSAIHPTENQKRVLAKIAASPTPTVAAEEISSNINLVAARNMLMKLGLITFAAGEAAMTDKGQQVAKEENITDEGGQLTDTGQRLAYTDAAGKSDNDSNGTSEPSSADDLNLESFALLKELLY